MRIALIAHDELKDEIVAFVEAHTDVLGECELVTTGTTGKRIAEATGLSVNRQASGPYGGDLQIGGLIADDRIDGVVFLRDPLTAQAPQPATPAPPRVCDAQDVPLAPTVPPAQLPLEGLPGGDSLH